MSNRQWVSCSRSSSQDLLTLAWGLSSTDDYFCSVLLFICETLHEAYPNLNDRIDVVVRKLAIIEALKEANLTEFAIFLINDGAFEIKMLRGLH